MKKQIATAAAITASFALWTAVSPQNTVDKEMPVQTQYTQLLHQTLTSELQKSAINAVKDSTRDCWQRLPAKMHHIDKD